MILSVRPCLSSNTFPSKMYGLEGTLDWKLYKSLHTISSFSIARVARLQVVKEFLGEYWTYLLTEIP